MIRPMALLGLTLCACAPAAPVEPATAIAEGAAAGRIVMAPSLPGMLSNTVTVRPVLTTETRPADTPRQAPREEVAVLPAPAPAPPPAAGGPVVQLATAGSEAAAMAHWRSLARRAPDLAEGREALVVAFERPGLPTLWRLRVRGFDSGEAAAAWCAMMRARRMACWVAV